MAQLVGVGSAAGRLHAGLERWPRLGLSLEHQHQRFPLHRPTDERQLDHESNVPSSGTYGGYICPTAKSTILYNGCYNSVADHHDHEEPRSARASRCSCSGYSNCSCTGSGSKKVCTQTVTTSGPPYKHDWIANAHSTWNGCVNDRDQDYDINNTAPSTSIPATLFAPHQYTACPAAMMPLSFDWTALNAKIDAMTPDGNTNVTIGLAAGVARRCPRSPRSTRRRPRRISTRSSSC